MATVDLTAGWTAPLEFQIMAGGAPFDLTGSMIELSLLAGAVAVDTSADVAVVDAQSGRVKYTPDPAELVAGKYRARWKVTTPAGVVFFPHGQADTWVVHAL